MRNYRILNERKGYSCSLFHPNFERKKISELFHLDFSKTISLSKFTVTISCTIVFHASSNSIRESFRLENVTWRSVDSNFFCVKSPTIRNDNQDCARVNRTVLQLIHSISPRRSFESSELDNCL